MLENHCNICYEQLKDAVELPCGHAFCSSCIRSHLVNNNTCPLFCEGEVSINSLRRSVIKTPVKKSIVLERVPY